MKTTLIISTIIAVFFILLGVSLASFIESLKFPIWIYIVGGSVLLIAAFIIQDKINKREKK